VQVGLLLGRLWQGDQQGDILEVSLLPVPLLLLERYSGCCIGDVCKGREDNLLLWEGFKGMCGVIAEQAREESHEKAPQATRRRCHLLLCAFDCWSSLNGSRAS
jgi:hypothetical protein